MLGTFTVHSPQVRLTLDQTGAAPEPQDTCSLQKEGQLTGIREIDGNSLSL